MNLPQQSRHLDLNIYSYFYNSNIINILYSFLLVIITLNVWIRSKNNIRTYNHHITIPFHFFACRLAWILRFFWNSLQIMNPTNLSYYFHDSIRIYPISITFLLILHWIIWNYFEKHRWILYISICNWAPALEQFGVCFRSLFKTIFFSQDYVLGSILLLKMVMQINFFTDSITTLSVGKTSTPTVKCSLDSFVFTI